ncbi:MAG: tRNA pseudouridine(54/55) synthase Pus10 [Candidatus Heimdallarchaeaceae archaeon]
MKILQKAMKLLTAYPLCDHCLGRQFSSAATGTTNFERGKAIKTLLVMEFSYPFSENNIEDLQYLSRSGSIMAKKALEKNNVIPHATEQCYICEDKLQLVKDLIPIIISAIQEYEYETFLIGTKLPNEFFIRENAIKHEFSTHNTEFLKQEFNREIGKRVGEITNKQTHFNKPDIVIECAPLQLSISLKVRSLYIYGRYKKYLRTIPQTHWDCRNCRGKGCKECNFTGKRYLESVEEFIGYEAVRLAKGEKAILHGSGREDIDVRMLGSGRPFVLEVTKPKIRTLNLEELTKRINAYAQNKVEVLNLRWSSKEEVAYLKTQAQQAVKKYRAIVKFAKAVSDEDIKHIENSFYEQELSQQTPNRVKHRRADKIRKKVVYSVKCKRIDEKRIEAIITCAGGTYVKELISGDEGRTEPSFSSEVGIQAICEELDVLEILEKSFLAH